MNFAGYLADWQWFLENSWHIAAWKALITATRFPIFFLGGSSKKCRRKIKQECCLLNDVTIFSKFRMVRMVIVYNCLYHLKVILTSYIHSYQPLMCFFLGRLRLRLRRTSMHKSFKKLRHAHAAHGLRLLAILHEGQQRADAYLGVCWCLLCWAGSSFDVFDRTSAFGTWWSTKQKGIFSTFNQLI